MKMMIITYRILLILLLTLSFLLSLTVARQPYLFTGWASGCGKGHWSDDDPNVCRICDVGTYDPSASNQFYFYGCPSCPAGSYQNQEGATTCMACGAGSFSTGGAPLCFACDRGTYSAEGAAMCTTRTTHTVVQHTTAIQQSHDSNSSSNSSAINKNAPCPIGVMMIINMLLIISFRNSSSSYF